jgi:hypothetical protein
MPTLSQVRRERLHATALGDLVSVKIPTAEDQWIFGLRVDLAGGAGGQVQPAVVALLPRPEGQGQGLDARLIPPMSHSPRDLIVNGNTRILNHGNTWDLFARAKDWNPDVHMDFGLPHSGTLLAQEVGPGLCGLRLAVAVPFAGACHLLPLDTWVLDAPSAGVELRYAATRHWNISLPGSGLDVQWPIAAPVP